MKNTDLNNVDPKLLLELDKINKRIDKINPTTEKEHKALRNLLKKRAACLTKILGRPVKSLFD